MSHMEDLRTPTLTPFSGSLGGSATSRTVEKQQVWREIRLLPGQEVEVVLLGEGRRVAEALRGGGACQLLSLSTVEKLLVCMISPLGGKGGWGL